GGGGGGSENLGGLEELGGLSSAAGGPFRGGPLWGRARPLEAVAAIDIGVGHTHGASFIRAGTGFPRLPLRSGCDRVDVWVDIGFGICPHPPDSLSQKAHASDSDQSAFHRLPPFGRNRFGKVPRKGECSKRCQLSFVQREPRPSVWHCKERSLGWGFENPTLSEGSTRKTHGADKYSSRN